MADSTQNGIDGETRKMKKKVVGRREKEARCRGQAVKIAS